MARPFFFLFLFSKSSLSVILVFFFISHFSIFSLAQKLETSFPAGTPATDGSSELVAKLRMQGALPTADRTTRCTGFTLTNPTSNPFWVLQITGHAPSTSVHHLALYGCTSQPSNPCACGMNSRTTIFVSSLNTPAIRFPITSDSYFGAPRQSGLQIGGQSTIQYVFIEVHYNGPLNIPDTTTGVDLQYTTTPLTAFVGIMPIMGVGTIPPHNSGYNLNSCVTVRILNQLNKVNVIGYQVHTHSLGRLVSVYQTYGSASGTYEIGRGNPQFPQAYYPYLKGNYMSLRNNFRILLRCVYDSQSQTEPTYTIGVSGHVGTEMCFANLLYLSTDLPTVTPLLKGDCTSQEVTFFPTASTTPFNSNPKLALHALYGNQTGTVQITSNGKYFMNLDLETF